MNESLNPKERLEKFVAGRGIKKPNTCGICNNWKSDKSDKTQREHAVQGRALCSIDNRIDKPFLHYSNVSCAKMSIVDFDTEAKRMKYFEGK